MAYFTIDILYVERSSTNKNDPRIINLYFHVYEFVYL